MSARILDTSVLLRHWKHRSGASLAGRTPDDAQHRAREAMDLYRSNVIVTAVYVEFIAGVRSSDELRLAERYLAQFKLLDDGESTKEDWEAAKRIAWRVPRSGKPRHLGDCLIRATAKRLRRDVYTLDKDFPK